VAARGAIVSEWPLGAPARREHFPQRNRLIAALARGVLVVEAALRSGSLITARLANEMGREVFAVPGSIHAPLSRGCHQLIKEGAKLTETPEDIFEELRIVPLPPAQADAPGATTGVDAAAAPRVPGMPTVPHAPAAANAGRPPEWARAASLPVRANPPQETRVDARATRVLDALGHAPATLEILAARTDIESAALQAALLELELAGHLHCLPGGRFVRSVRKPP
jgi:DNA processing protein